MTADSLRPTHTEPAEDGVVPVRRWLQTPHAGHVSALVWGRGPATAVLVHDLGGEAADWSGVVAGLVDATATTAIVAIDLPGHGRSSATTGPPPPAERAAPAVIDAIRSLAPSATVVAGTGYGAAVALAAARRRPDVVRAVAVVGVVPPTDLAAVTVPVTTIDGGLDEPGLIAAGLLDTVGAAS